MNKNLGTKAIGILVVLLGCVYGIIGIPHGGLKQSLKNRIHLGLDLQGGIHLVLKVNVIEAVNSATDRDMQALNTALAQYSATAAKLDPKHPETITVTGATLNNQSDVHSLLNGNDYQNYDVNSSGSGSFTMTMKQSAIRDLEQRTLDTSIETIRARVDALGVSEPQIEQYNLGDNEILVQLPGISDADHVEDIIKSTAKLEIHPVVCSRPCEAYASEDAALQSVGGAMPPDEEILKGTAGNGGTDGFYILKRAAIVEGTDFRDAQPSTDENGRPDITFTLTTDAGDRFYKYTNDNKGTGSMAIVLENRIREVATIEGAIREQGRISGGGISPEYAQSLSMMLRTGSLPASITYLETRTVGPSLGAESIHAGVMAAIFGMLAVMVFMLVYYKGAGINADLALVLNLVILLGFMGFFEATLTLPGIAGVILTIGMGVDSNVLIFERIREELRLGKTAAIAVQDGFGHAWITIIDTHVTTVVSALILLVFGSGPVKGFALTLIFGLLANIFTAVFVSRVIFDWLLSRKGRDAVLSI
jgi:preprotein translocase subunit SecD